MTGEALRHSVRKEIRALFPTWAACMFAVAAADVYPRTFFASFAVLAYGLGSLALGAQAIGHEYTHRTLALLLTHPAERRALFFVKFGVLAPMLLALGGVALIVFEGPGGNARPPVDWQTVALVTLSSLFVAPALTMWSRSVMAGLLFTSFPPAGLWLAAGLIGIARFGSGADAQIDAFARMMLWRGMLAIAAVAAVSSWVMFMRLEAVEGGGRDLHLPQWLFRAGRTAAGAGGLRKRHPVLQLIAKELYVQQVAFAVTGIFALGIGFVVVRRYFDPNVDMDLAVPMALIHFAVLSMVIGSMASAEERQMGTLQWQLLLPIPAWHQWLVKAGVAIGLALALGLGVPALMALISSGPVIPRLSWTFATTVVALTSISLYVSSLCTSGIRALVLSVPVLLAARVALSWTESTLFWLHWKWRGRDILLPPYRTLSEVMWGMTAAVGLAAALLLYFAYRNHRSSERPFTQVRRQAGWIAGLVLVEMVLLRLAGIDR